MKRITSLAFSNSFITAFMRSSNWPRYFVPATRDAKSKVTILLSKRTLLTFFSMIFNARPSTMAVLPTPGSPIKTGLFFFLLDNTCATRSISFSLPMTGSSLPSLASFVRSLPKLSKTGVFCLSACCDFEDEERIFSGFEDEFFPLMILSNSLRTSS